MSCGIGQLGRSVSPVVVEEYGIRCSPSEAGVSASAVKVVKVDSDLAPGLGHVLIGLEVDLLVLQASPQPLDEDVVQPAAPSVHRDRYTVPFEYAREGFGGELGALISVEDLRSTVGEDGLLEGLDAEVRLHGVREPPRENAPGVPVDHRDQVKEALGHRDKRDVGRVDLPRAVDGKAPQTIGILLRRYRRSVGLAWHRGSWLRMQRRRTGTRPMPISRISRWTHLRLTRPFAPVSALSVPNPSVSSSSGMRRDPRNGYLMWIRSIRRISAPPYGGVGFGR